MVHYLFLLALWYTISYLPIGCLYGTLLSSSDPLALSIVHNYLLLAHFPTAPNMSLWYTTIFYWPIDYLYGTLPYSSFPLAICMIHYYLLLAHWLSLWYTTICFWPIGCLCDALLSSIGQLVMLITIFYWPTGFSWPSGPFLCNTTIFYLPICCFYGTLHLLPANWLSLWYTTIFYWSTGYLYGAQPPSTRALTLPWVLYYLLLAHWLSL